MKKLKEAFKRVKLRNLIVLIILLIFNAYAWFVFSTKVSGDIDTHIEAWDVVFQVGEEEVVSQINFEVGKIYPGMEKYQKIIVAHNFGEKKAELTCVIKEVTILGETYLISDPSPTSEDLLQMLEEDYPFHVKIVMTNTILNEEDGTSTITISLVWPYEQGDDALDTEWGEAAADFYKEMLQELNQGNENETNELDIGRGDIVSVSVKMELKATQI